jgi:hypothetical protein
MGHFSIIEPEKFIRAAAVLEPVAQPIFPVILNEVKDLNLLKIRDSSRHSA